MDDLVPPPGARSANVQIIQSVGGAGQFTFYWDDVFLEPIE